MKKPVLLALIGAFVVGVSIPTVFLPGCLIGGFLFGYNLEEALEII